MFKKEYRISASNDDWVTPEETLLDSGSEYSDLEKPISSSLFSYIFTGILVFTGIVMSMTMKISVVEYDKFANLSLQNSTANFFIPPPRGLIFDRKTDCS